MNESTTDNTNKERKAGRLMLWGNYKDALKLYQVLFEKTGDPDFLDLQRDCATLLNNTELLRRVDELGIERGVYQPIEGVYPPVTRKLSPQPQLG